MSYIFDTYTITDTQILEEIDTLDIKVTWKRNVLFFLVSVLLFAGFGLMELKPTELLILITVIIIHELGHFTGMKAFSYSDPKIFFIPGLGAAVSARKSSGRASHAAIVSLLGPVPGIFIGIAFVVTYFISENRLWYDFAESFLLINLFNLLPIFPLDGGRFFEAVLFRKHPFFELIFRIITGLLLLSFGIISKSGFLISFPIFFLITIPELFKISRIVQKIKRVKPFPTEPLKQVSLIREFLNETFPTHASRKKFILRMKHLIDRYSETTISIRKTITLVIFYFVLLPFSLYVTFVPLFLFMEPRNLSIIKHPKEYTGYRLSPNNHIMNSRIFQHFITMLENDPENDIIEKRSDNDVHVGIIAVSSSAEVENIRSLILSGSSFKKMAKMYSTGPNAKNGGDIGYVNPEYLDTAIVNKLDKLHPGEISCAIKTGDEYVIIKKLK